MEVKASSSSMTHQAILLFGLKAAEHHYKYCHIALKSTINILGLAFYQKYWLVILEERKAKRDLVMGEFRDIYVIYPGIDKRSWNWEVK